MRRIVSLALCMLLLCLSCAGCAAEEAAGTRLIALNVGKGDCLLLLFENRAYLIDAGYAHTWNLLREALEQYGVSRLNGVFLTHCDKDHYGGLMPLALSGVDVDAWYAAAIYYDVKPGQHPMELAAAARNEKVLYLHAGDTLALGENASLRVVGPLQCNTENENNNSLVFYVETADATLLFTGDMKLAEEAELLQAGLITPADVLKVPFHGDNSASSESFVSAVSPQAALISTSTAEEPDTPASSILKRYSRHGAQIYVTQDYERGVEITLSGGRSLVSPLEWDVPDYRGSIRAEILLEDDLLVLHSTAKEDISLAGWLLFSSRGEDSVTLPEDALLPAGGVYKVGTRATAGEVSLSLDMKRLWHKSKHDRAILYDSTGGIAAVTDNGMPE